MSIFTVSSFSFAASLFILSTGVDSTSPYGVIVEMKSNILINMKHQGCCPGICPFFHTGNHIQLSIFAQSIKVINEQVEEEPYTIEFASDKWRLSQKGREIVRNAARKISNEGASQVLIVGHADQRGSPEYNLRLSRHRSEAVLRAMLQENISPNIIKVEWKGEFDPSVPVGDNDHESKNRRVVIHVFR